MNKNFHEIKAKYKGQLNKRYNNDISFIVGILVLISCKMNKQ